MKVLVVTNMYPTAGHRYYGIFVAEQMTSLAAGGCDVDLFFINPKESRLNYFSLVPSLASQIRDGDYDVIHAHHTYCVFPLMAARLFGAPRRPLVFTFHEGESHLSWDQKPKDVGLIRKLVFAKWPKRAALRQADLVIPVAEGLLDQLDFKGKSIVLPPGVDLELFRPMDRRECREALGIGLEKRVVFFPPSPAKRTEKGLDLLEAALSLLSREDIELVVGGNIDHEKMPFFLNAADVVVHPSRFEASPMVVKEALACCAPIVSSDTGDARLVIGETAGCYICELDPADIAKKIEAALEFAGPTAGRERITDLGLSLDQVASKIRLQYEQLVSSSGGRSGR